MMATSAVCDIAFGRAAPGICVRDMQADKGYGQRAFVFADPDGNRIDIGERL